MGYNFAEISSKYFEIERSPDEKTGPKIGIVAAADSNNIKSVIFC